MDTKTLRTLPPNDCLVGRTIQRYEFVELLGRGTLGVVYRAHDHQLERDVAIKVSDPQLVRHGAVLDYFMREARIQARLEHGSIAPIYDLFEEGESAFIVMRLVDGDNLRTKMENRANPLEPVEALTFMRHVFDAVGFAHQRGVIHQDLKPENIYVTSAGEPLVLDFSAAQLVGDTRSGTARSIGTPNYMAPEQIEGRYTDARTDIYALGLMLYEMVTGHHPFESETSVDAMLRAQVESEPLSPRHFNPAIPAGFGHAILRAISKPQRHRFRWCYEFAQALDASLGGRTHHVIQPSDVRWDPRAPVSLPFQIQLADTEKRIFRARTLDLSVGGAAVQVDRALDPGTTVWVALKLSGHDPIVVVEAEARVAWVRKAEDEVSFTTGINFTDLMDSGRRAIAGRVREALLLGKHAPT